MLNALTIVQPATVEEIIGDNSNEFTDRITVSATLNELRKRELVVSEKSKSGLCWSVTDSQGLEKVGVEIIVPTDKDFDVSEFGFEDSVKAFSVLSEGEQLCLWGQAKIAHHVALNEKVWGEGSA